MQLLSESEVQLLPSQTQRFGNKLFSQLVSYQHLYWFRSDKSNCVPLWTCQCQYNRAEVLNIVESKIEGCSLFCFSSLSTVNRIDRLLLSGRMRLTHGQSSL